MIKRVIELTHSEACKIRARQRAGTMNEYFDDEKYLCYETDELDTYKPRKTGRPLKSRVKNGESI